MPHIITKACTKCGACLNECPTSAIAEGKDKYVIDTDVCSDHMLCVSVCPVNAIEPQPISELAKALREEEEEEEEEEET